MGYLKKLFLFSNALRDIIAFQQQKYSFLPLFVCLSLVMLVFPCLSLVILIFSTTQFA